MNVSPCSNQHASDAHVVVLTNYLRKHHVLAMLELQRLVGKLTILLSTEMEPDRGWQAEWSELNVEVQKNWMLTTRWKHMGFTTPNFIHIPVDTVSQLKRLKPDVVVSYEFGMRTLFCTRFRKKCPETPLIMVGNMSEHIERDRGFARRMLRRHLVKGIDYFTYNGPSCRRYLESLGIAEERLFHAPYCFDFDKAFLGDRAPATHSQPRRFVFAGTLCGRKGLFKCTTAMKKWFLQNPEQQAEVIVCGDGQDQAKIADCQTENLRFNFRGNCDEAQLRDAYESADVCLFPTLADEWGLVPIEAMASGLPVLGSRYAQSVESLVREDENGWTYRTDREDEFLEGLESCMSKSADEIHQMGNVARRSVEHITPERSGECFAAVIEHAISKVTSPART